MAYLDRAGVRIWYECEGDGPSLLLTHGFMGTARLWADQVRAFAPTHRVITWDIRGHGRSDSPDDQAEYTHAATLGDMAGVLDACGAGRAVLGGHSLGGYLSLAFALDHPDRVAALLLVDAGPGFRSADARQRWNEQMDRSANRVTERGLGALGARADVGGGTHRSADGLGRAARGISSHIDSRVIDGLGSITVPTLVLVGADDEAFLGAAAYMAAKIPGATEVVIEGAGHAANLDRPAEFNSAVAAFLERLSRGG